MSAYLNSSCPEYCNFSLSFLESLNSNYSLLGERSLSSPFPQTKLFCSAYNCCKLWSRIQVGNQLSPERMSQPVLTHCSVEDDTSLVRFVVVFSLYTVTPTQTWELCVCRPEMWFMCRRFQVGAKIPAILRTDWFPRVSYAHKIQVFIKSSCLHLINIQSYYNNWTFKKDRLLDRNNLVTEIPKFIY